MELLVYSISALPISIRLMIAARYWTQMSEPLPEPALDRPDHRTILVAFAGFSFAGLLGLVALPGSLEERRVSIWFVLTSFICLLAALNLQGYKSLRWHDMLGDALLESASLALIGSVIAFIARSELALTFKVASATLAGLVWTIDFIIRARLTAAFLGDKEDRDGIKDSAP